MTERSQWTEYKMNNQIYKQRTAEHNQGQGLGLEGLVLVNISGSVFTLPTALHMLTSL